MTRLSQLSIDELAEGICLRAGRIAAAEAELLAWIAEFDRREGWAGVGMLSCASWLTWKIGLGAGAARERVRVARRLAELPAIAAAFAAGRMSFSQVRAVTRVATPDDGIDWPELARHSSAAQLERITRGIRRVQNAEAAAADPQAATYAVRTRTRYDADGNMTITIYANAEDGAVILAGLQAQRAQLDRQRQAEAESVEPADDGPDVCAGTPAVDAASPIGRVSAETSARQPDDDEPVPGWPAGSTYGELRRAIGGFRRTWGTPARDADGAAADDVAAGSPGGRRTSDRAGRFGDVSAETLRRGRIPTGPAPATDGEALLALARTALDDQQSEHPAVARRTRARLTAQIDPLSGWGRLRDGELLPPTSLRQVLKTLPGRGGTLRLRPLTNADLTRHDLGRRTRDVSEPLRELLGTLDGERCRFPGCTRHRKLHAHHVTYWSRGGRTDLANLVLLCSRHHTLVHQQDFRLILHPDRRLDVRTADGVAILHHPAAPWGDPNQLDPGRHVSAETLPPTHCDARIDLGYVVHVLLQQAA